MTGFLYKTIRAEWSIFAHYAIGRGAKIFGPFPSEEEAFTEASRIEESGGYKSVEVKYREKDVPIDPIVTDLLDKVCEMLEGHVDRKLIRKHKPRRNAAYLHENVVRGSLKTLGEEIKALVQTDLENPHAEAHPR